MFENVNIALSNSNIYNLSNKLINSIINNQHHFHIEVNYQEDSNGQPIEIGNSTGWWFEFIIMNCYKIKFKVKDTTTFCIYMADVDREYSSDYATLDIKSSSNPSIQYLLIQNPDFSFPDSNCEYTLLAFASGSTTLSSNGGYCGCFTIKIKDKDTDNYIYFYSNKFSKTNISELLNNGIVKYDNKYIMNINTIFNFNYDSIIHTEAIINDGYMSDIQCKYNILSTSNLSYGYHYEMNTNKYFSLTKNILLLYE